jgi:hypothetical protein
MTANQTSGPPPQVRRSFLQRLSVGHNRFDACLLAYLRARRSRLKGMLQEK